MGNPSCASICSGGKLADIGLMAAGYTPLWGVEMDEAIADVANANVPALTLRQRVQDVAWGKLERPTLMWASPPCPNFSAAKTGGKETADDLAIADAVCAAIRTLTPPLFVLENVLKYRKSRSFGRICATLNALGYWFTEEHVNSADFGVPQTRRRLIVRACRGGLIAPLPNALPWVGWYSAIEDLIPTLPESAFAPWQLARLPEYLGASVLAHPNSDSDRFPAPEAGEPAFTVGTFSGGQPRAFLMRSTNAGQEWGKGYHEADEPAMTLTAQMNRDSRLPRGFLVSGQSVEGGAAAMRDGDDPSVTIAGNADRMRAFLIGGGNTQLAQVDSKARGADDPAFTVAANHSALTNQRAFIVHPNNQRRMTVRDEEEPVFTVMANGHDSRQPSLSPRAFIVDDQNGAQGKTDEARGLTIREAADPMFTLKAHHSKQPARAWLDEGRVVKMTPRALARFQSIPDSYQLPDVAKVSARVIGNAVPPLLAEAIGRSLMPHN